MDKDLVDVKLGSAGDVDLSIKGGVVLVVLSAAKAELGLSAGVQLSLDPVILGDLLLDAAASKLPQGVVLTEAVALLKGALAALKA